MKKIIFLYLNDLFKICPSYCIVFCVIDRDAGRQALPSRDDPLTSLPFLPTKTTTAPYLHTSVWLRQISARAVAFAS